MTGSQTKRSISRSMTYKGCSFRRIEDVIKWVVLRMFRAKIVKLCYDDQGHFALGEIKIS